MDFDEQSRLAAATSNRLRLLHADLSDHPPAERQAFLTEEIRRAAAALPVHERGAFLATLEQLFPRWEQTVVVEAAPKADAKESKLPRDAIAAATLLVSLLPANPDDPHRREVVAMLDKAGLIPKAAPASAGAAEWPEDRVTTLRQKLTISGPFTLEGGRVLDALLILMEFAENLEQFSYAACKQAAPENSSKLRRGDLKTVLNQYLGGSQDITRGQINVAIQRIKTCASAIVSAPPKIWEQFPEKLQHLTPSEIQQRVDSDASTSQKMLGIEKAYWRKFVQLASDLREDTLQETVRDIVQKYIEPIINER